MDYYMNMREFKFFIANENKAAALQAIKNLAGKETYGSHFAWVSTEMFLKAKNLEKAMSVWRWGISENENGDIDEIQFNGEKLGDDELLFKAIAPFVKEGSYIEMRGDDNAIWRWYFTGKDCIELTPTITWDIPKEEK